jgi:hypothetical protein
VWPGISAAEEAFGSKAEQQGSSTAYRKQLRKHYQRLIELVREALAAKELGDVSD